MKGILISLLTFILSTTTVHGQSSATLHLAQNRLQGNCSHPYFTGFTIELDANHRRLDSEDFLKMFPRIGTINFRNTVDVPTEYTITERAGFPQIIFRFRTTYLTFDNLKIESDKITFDMNSDPEVPATEDDLVIINIAKGLLSSEAFWHKEDDRLCHDDLAKKSYSLYCALRIASIEVEEKYNHRNAVLQKLRHLIEEEYPERKWQHRLMDYNNMPETSFDDIVNILEKIESDFLVELEEK